MRAVVPPQAEEKGAILTTGTLRGEKTLWWLEMEARMLGEERLRRRQATSGARKEPEPKVERNHSTCSCLKKRSQNLP